MKTKEQKRREAYDRMVKSAQQAYKRYEEVENWTEVNEVTRLNLLSVAKAKSREVWDFHHQFGFPLPDPHTFYDR